MIEKCSKIYQGLKKKQVEKRIGIPCDKGSLRIENIRNSNLNPNKKNLRRKKLFCCDKNRVPPLLFILKDYLFENPKKHNKFYYLLT